MSTVTSVVNHFPTANEGFVTTLGSTILAGAVTVPLTSVSGLTNGTIFVGIIEPGLANQQTFTGTVDTAGVQITSVKWTRGTNVDHTAGVTIVDYVSGTGQNMMTKGIQVNHTQTGSHKTLTDGNGNEWLELGTTASAVNQLKATNAATGTAPSLSASGDDTNIDLKLVPKGSGQVVFGGAYDGWSTGALPAQSGTIVNNGNRNYDIPFASTVAGILSPGMRLRTTRTVAAPTQCTSLNGTTQYYSKASPNKLTFTNNFVVSAWIKLSSYGNTAIASRFDGTSGWSLEVTASGQVNLAGYNAGAGNLCYVQSYQSVPLNKWVHVTAQLDMTVTTNLPTTNYVMIDGTDVPAIVTRAGTSPTALIQAGNLNIGARNALIFFPGKIAQVAIYNAKVTQANVKLTISQGLSGSETSLASAYSFNNAITDLNTTTPNDLTANGSAVATNADSPFGNAGTSSTLDYALVQAVSTTVATVQVPEGCTIPTSGGVTSVAYSVQGNPYGWVSDKGRWRVAWLAKADYTQNSPAAGTWYNMTTASGTQGGAVLNVPVGSFDITYAAVCITTGGGATAASMFVTLSTANNTEIDTANTARIYGSTNAMAVASELTRTIPVNTTVATNYYLNAKSDVATAVISFICGSGAATMYALPSGL
jgi:hypothetical protein